MNFTLDNLKNSQNSVERLKRIISEIKEDGKTNEKYLKKFEKAMDDDLNTVSALQVLWELVRDTKAEGKIKTIKRIDSVFGFDLLKTEKVDVPEEGMELVKEREQSREDKHWDNADKLRDKIEKKGFRVSDSGNGSKIEKI